jgi:hypothetical protein
MIGCDTATREQGRSSIMRRIRILVLAALAVFALGAFTSTAAQASEGPFYRVCQKVAAGLNGSFMDNECTKPGTTLNGWNKIRLMEKETTEIEAKAASKEFVLANGVQTLRCKKMTVEKGAVIIGSTGANAGGGEGVGVFEECTIEGNGAGCEVEGKKIKTEPVKVTLDFAKEIPVKGDVHLIMFAPVTGNVLTKLKFVGTGCTLITATIEGKGGGQLDNGKQELLKLEENEELSAKNLVRFPTTLIKEEWVEKGGKREKIAMGIKSFGKAVTKAEGELTGTLVSGNHFGVFSK